MLMQEKNKEKEEEEESDDAISRKCAATNINTTTPAAATSVGQKRGVVRMGQCTWQDQDLVASGKFFPSHVKQPNDRLLFVSMHFPCVEVDSSHYAITPPATTKKWADTVAKDFKFHFKAFSMFTNRSIGARTLPQHIRDVFSDSLDQPVRWEELTSSQQDDLWDAFHESIRPVSDAGKLGLILFQFPGSFSADSSDSVTHLRYCREKLDSNCTMAVEFRNTNWFNDQYLDTTLNLLSELGISLVITDEVRDWDAFNRKYSNSSLQERKKSRIIPLILAVTHPTTIYIRVHRREGSERILGADEISAWVGRITKLMGENSQIETIWMVWNTNHEDQSIINSRNMSKALSDWDSNHPSSNHSLLFEWKRKDNTTIASFFQPSDKLAAQKRLEEEDSSIINTKSKGKEPESEGQTEQQEKEKEKRKQPVSPTKSPTKSKKKAKTSTSPTKQQPSLLSFFERKDK